MANYWIKLKHDVLTDPKMGMLNDRVWRLAIELFLLAGVTNKDGQLPSAADISWILRKDYATFLEDLKVLEDVGIIRYENSAPFVTNFAKHQARMPDAERKRKDREAARKEKEAGTDLSTDCPQNGQLVDTDKEEEREEETDKETDGEQKRTAYPLKVEGVWSAYAENFGSLNGNQDELRRMVNTFDADNVLDAMTYCIERNKKSIAYLKSVLVGRRRDGKI